MYIDIIWFLFSCSTLEYEENKRKEPIYILIISLCMKFPCTFSWKKGKEEWTCSCTKASAIVGLGSLPNWASVPIEAHSIEFCWIGPLWFLLGWVSLGLARTGGVNIINYLFWVMKSGDGGGSQPNKLVYGPCCWDHFLQLKIDYYKILEPFVRVFKQQFSFFFF